MTKHCLLLGMLGWASAVRRALDEHGIENQYIQTLNGLLVFNTTKRHLRQIMSDHGFGGGRIIEFED